MAFYRPSTSPYQFPTTMQTWTSGSQRRIVGASMVSASTSNSAGASCRIFNWLKRQKGLNYAMEYFRMASYGPYKLNKQGTALIWN